MKVYELLTLLNKFLLFECREDTELSAMCLPLPTEERTGGEGILGNYNRFNLKGKAVVIETTYQLNQGSILHHEYKQHLLIWQHDVLVYKHVQEY